MYKRSLEKELSALKEKLSLEDMPVGIQLPEGLKQYSTLVVDSLRDFNPILFVDPMFGACDLRDDEAKKFGCKSLIHFGHTGMGAPSIKTFFVPLYYELSDIEVSFIVEEVKKLDLRKVNLVTTINYLVHVPRLSDELKKLGVEVLVSKSTSHVKQNMVLGCDASTIIDASVPVVFIGDGKFHPNNLGFVFDSVDVFVIDPINKASQKLVVSDSFIKQRYVVVSKALKCNSFGIFVSSKKGQFRLRFANFIKKKLEAIGKKAYIFACDYVNESYVEGVDVDCFVNTACPRIAYDDISSFSKPMLSPQEVFLLEDINSGLKIDQIRDLESFFN